MSIADIRWTARCDRAALAIVDDTGRPLAAHDVVLISRETINLTIAFLDGRSAAAFAEDAAFRFVAKDPDDLDGNVLADSTNVTSSAADLAAGIVTFGELSLNTVELIAFIGSDDGKRLRVEVVETNAGVEQRVLLRTDVLLLHDTLQGDEADPVRVNSLLHNPAAAAAPTTGDDGDDGYAPGSLWLWRDGDLPARVYWCLDAAAGAARWEELTSVELAFALEAPGDADIPLLPYVQSASAYRVEALAIKTASGSCTAALKIGDVAVPGISEVSVTDSMTVAARTSVNALEAGNSLTLVLSASAAAIWVQGSVLLRRV